MEQKYRIGTKSGAIMWDIEKIKNDVTLYPIKEYDTYKLFEQTPFHGDKQYAMNTDLSIPMIIVELCNGKDKLIDGNHRLFKARGLNIPTVSAYYLTETQHKKYIVDYEAELYNKVVKELFEEN